MIGRTLFEQIKARWGGYASWAVWAEASDKPKSNVGDLSVLDADANGSLLQTLKGDVVMVGLNISRPLPEPFRNFHDPSPRAHDFKLRYAFTNTAYCGAYMTDIIKNVPMVNSSALLEYVRASPSLLRENVATFLAELADLSSGRPTVLAFGAAAHGLLAKNIPAGAYTRLVRLTHYSHRVGKEQYRRTVLREVGSG